MIRISTAAFGLALLGTAAWAPHSLAATRTSHDLSGVWWTKAYQPKLAPDHGHPLPFTPEGRRLYAANIKGLKDHSIVDQAAFSCVPEGMPRAMTSAYPFQIIQTAQQLVFAHEANRAYRIVMLTDKHADAKVWDPSYMGDGIGRWDGDTLVIDSTNFKSDAIYLDSTGLPASDKLHLVERIKLTDGGKRLEDRITVDDPTIFTRPWTARRTFERRGDIKVGVDWVCGEPHRNVTAITRGAMK